MFSAKLYFLKNYLPLVHPKLKMFDIGLTEEIGELESSPPREALSRIGPVEELICYQLFREPPLVEELLLYMKQKAPKNTLERLCVNLHAAGVKSGLAISTKQFKGEWREFVTPEGDFMKLERLFVPRTSLLPHFPEFGVFVRSWNTWRTDGLTPEEEVW